MSPLDFNTVLLFAALVTASLALALGLLAWRDRSRQLRDWTLSLSLALAGLVIFALRGQLPPWSTSFLANVLLLAALVFSWAGYARAAGRARPWWLFAGLLVAEALLSFWISQAADGTRSRVLLFNASWLLFAAANLLLLWQLRRRLPGTVLALPLLAHGLQALGALARILMLLTWPELPTGSAAHVLAIMVSCLGLVVMGLGFMALRTGQLLDDLERQALTDPLTGLLNRRGFAAVAAREWSRHRRSGAPLALLMLDIDHFKRINDEHGHAQGDDVLHSLGQALPTLLRPYDVCARLGGEEFCVLLPGSDAIGARLSAARLLALALQVGGEPVTVSIGISALRSDDADIDALMARADAALYRAKQQGRHRAEEN